MGYDMQSYFGHYLECEKSKYEKVIKIKGCPNQHKISKNDIFCSTCGSKIDDIDKITYSYKGIRNAYLNGQQIESFLDGRFSLVDPERFIFKDETKELLIPNFKTIGSFDLENSSGIIIDENQIEEIRQKFPWTDEDLKILVENIQYKTIVRKFGLVVYYI